MEFLIASQRMDFDREQVFENRRLFSHRQRLKQLGQEGSGGNDHWMPGLGETVRIDEVIILNDLKCVRRAGLLLVMAQRGTEIVV